MTADRLPLRPAGMPMRGPAGGMALHVACLDELRMRLAELGMRAELREHLLSLMVFAALRELPLCVFVTPDGQYFSWRDGAELHPVTDLHGAAQRLQRACSRNLPAADSQPDSEQMRKSRAPEQSAG